MGISAQDDWQQPLQLGDDEVHLWLCFPETIRDPTLLRRYHVFLNEAEAAQQRRFYFEKDRHSYLVTRAMIRSLLTRYVPQRREAMWEFDKNEYGRPHLKPDQDAPNLRFNISHTKGLIAIGFCLDQEIGVDVENVQRSGDQVAIADRFFSPTEVAELKTLPYHRQEDRFFDYWTLKESYIKARGMGLSIPLADFSFLLGQGTQIGIDVVASQNDDPARWQFKQWHVSERHRMAMTLERRPGTRFSLTMRQTVPLLHSQPFRCAQTRDSFD